MGALLLPRRLQQQPQQVAVIDQGNQVTRGLRAAAVPGMAEAVTGAWPVQVIGTGGLVLGATSAGRTWALTQDAFEFASVPFLAGSFSVIVTVKKNGADVSVSFGGAGAGNGWKIGSVPTAASSFRVTFGGVADYDLATDFWDVSGGVTTALLTFDATTKLAKLYKGGRFVASRTLGTMRVPTKPLTIGAAFSTSYSELSNSDISLVALWGRALSDAEAFSLTLNPWQLFMTPARRLWATAAVPPAATATISWTEQAETSSAQATARVSAAATWTETPETPAAGVRLEALAAAAWTETPDGISTTARAEVRAAVAWSEAPEQFLADAGVGVIATTTWTEAPEHPALSGQVGPDGGAIEVEAGIGWAEAAETVALAGRADVLATAGWAEEREGVQAHAEVEHPPGDIDVDHIPGYRMVVFEGSKRIIPFDGSKRVVTFEGSNRTVRFE